MSDIALRKRRVRFFIYVLLHQLPTPMVQSIMFSSSINLSSTPSPSVVSLNYEFVWKENLEIIRSNLQILEGKKLQVMQGCADLLRKQKLRSFCQVLQRDSIWKYWKTNVRIPGTTDTDVFFCHKHRDLCKRTTHGGGKKGSRTLNWSYCGLILVNSATWGQELELSISFSMRRDK